MSKKIREQFVKETGKSPADWEMNSPVFHPKYVEWLEAKAEQHEPIVMWRDADDPPEGNEDKWSRKVISVTNFGNVYSLCYYHGMNGGNWQRRVVFEDGEKVNKWTEFPAI